MKSFSLILLCFLLLTGCVQQQIIDEVNVETGLGFDLLEGNRIKGTVLYPQFLPDKSVNNVTIVESAKVSRDLLSKLERQSNQPLVTGSLEVVLFGKKLAKEGFFHLIDSLQRDPNIGSRIDLAVVDGTAEEVLQGKYGMEGNGVYIKSLMDHNMKYRDVPRQNLHLFASYLYSKGRTTYLPIIRKVNNTELEISGMGLFNNKRLVQKIGEEKMFFFKILVDKYSEGSETIKLDGDEAVVRSISSTNKIKVNTHKHPTEVTIEVKVNGVIREFTGNHLDMKKENVIREKFEKIIKKETLSMLKQFQKNHIDPVGIGERVQSVTRHFNWSKWRDEYPNVKFKVKPKVIIMESGTVE
ncbi:Ger(x)C family spore germination protein [Heyndrickxia acidicola]|uniref:Ger(X)C family spore germination protein n=1 Tax=Heyndrickxia acidicola TaxID=209389 RepID=A0ABU6MGL8_9BACI|nr:Ger(x)C family spore germination protein [Heyndrickxia acidicola]MED1203821.1 Ger(x)C family spore germination protein [Heyndrickxia acidicola]